MKRAPCRRPPCRAAARPSRWTPPLAPRSPPARPALPPPAAARPPAAVSELASRPPDVKIIHKHCCKSSTTQHVQHDSTPARSHCGRGLLTLETHRLRELRDLSTQREHLILQLLALLRPLRRRRAAASRASLGTRMWPGAHGRAVLAARGGQATVELVCHLPVQSHMI